ncbi:MAG: glycosyltransferase, partial [Duncaniella sp.]|nr:glycosyltransferase [Duncaniella sp.]
MKILHFIGTNSTGGVATIVHYLAAYHSAQGHQVDLLSNCHDSSRLDSTGKFESLGCNVFTSATDRRYSPRQLRQLMKRMNDYDIVHVHQFPNQLWGALASLLRRGRNKPKIITTEHTTFTNRRRHPALKYYDRWMYNLYDHVACISPATRDALIEWLGKDYLADRISVITNGIDFDRFHDASMSHPDG